MRKRAYKEIYVGGTGGCLYFFSSCIGLSVRDILGNGTVKEPRILQDHAKLTPKIGTSQIARVYSVKCDASAVDLIEAHQQVDEGGLAGTRCANDGYLLPRMSYEIHIMHQGIVLVVSKTDVFKGNAAAYGIGQGGGSQWISHNFGSIKKVEDTFGCGKSALQHIYRERKLRKRLGCLGEILKDSLEYAYAQLA